MTHLGEERGLSTPFLILVASGLWLREINLNRLVAIAIEIFEDVDVVGADAVVTTESENRVLGILAIVLVDNRHKVAISLTKVVVVGERLADVQVEHAPTQLLESVNETSIQVSLRVREKCCILIGVCHIITY